MLPMKTNAPADRRIKAVPLMVLAVWVAVIACFFYNLVRAGSPVQ